ncbi:protein of unknown function [Cupriavidus taiwanensis]|uniref:Uncharacterized protein n=1 Tax=Cupriavidus taiwanensis TaxID=164546 RepID=A0A7Z7NL51_9BURK|nr:protein of unknown function [Cupriavidus taiwanensis]SOZ04373.1 hypothetical protein CBM2595_A50016 [Cupriavidus taiwanensis]SPC09809.1 hypothetical protein CBM2594_A41132 [Cupriavidus taiwanensis]SPD39594.1 protein of unknown function [Cupriavidus taiwanensis]
MPGPGNRRGPGTAKVKQGRMNGSVSLPEALRRCRPDPPRGPASRAAPRSWLIKLP